MTVDDQPNGSREERLLALQAAVQRSRSGVLAARRGPSNTQEIREAQTALLVALERFVAALDAAGHTTPHQIHHELVLLRAVAGSSGR